MGKQHKILFVSGELEEGVRFKNLFNAHFKGTDFFHAGNDSEAFDYMSEIERFAIVVIDAALRVDDLDYFFSEISRLNSNYPIIFYGTEAFLKSRVPDNMYDFNLASGLILRPLIINDFLSSVRRSLSWVREKEVKEATVDLSAENFIPFRIRSFYRLQTVPYPVFMQITESKFIRVFEADERYTHEQMHRYVKKGVKFFYFEKKDYLLFLSETMGKLRSLLQNRSPSFELTIKAQVQGCMIVQEYARTIGLNDSIVDFINLIIDSIQSTYEGVGDLKKILVSFPFMERDLYERAILTAYTSTSIIAELGWKGDLTQQKLGVASIFYDSLVTNEEFLKYASVEDMECQNNFSEDDIEEFKNHPSRAAELVRLSQGLPECDFIIQQHHERPDGRGYPQGIPSHQISGVVAIFILSSEFSQQLAHFGISKKSLKMVTDDFYLRYNAGNFKEPLKLLTQMLDGTGKKK